MIKKILPITAVAALLLILISPAPVVLADEAIGAALNWVKAQEGADGGFSNGFSPESDVSTTAEAVIALAAGGQDAGTVRSSNGASPLDYLYQQVKTSQLEGTGIKAKVVLALVAAGLNPSDFAGQDLVAQLEAAYDPDSGSYSGSIFDQALVMLALTNAGRAVPEGAADYLMTYQTTDGAWSFTGDTAALSGDTNTTALVIQALAAAGRKDDAGRALAYLQRVQNSDAGWPYQNPSPYGTETDANSTALVIQAIHAVGQPLGDWYVQGTDPLGALLSLQNDSGSFSFQASFPGDNMLATVQAIPAAAGVTLAAVSRLPTSAVPGAVAVGAPSTLPEAGAGVIPTAIGIVVFGWLLVLTGHWLKRNNRRTAL
jgi:hypothetical protein